MNDPIQSDIQDELRDKTKLDEVKQEVLDYLEDRINIMRRCSMPTYVSHLRTIKDVVKEIKE